MSMIKSDSKAPKAESQNSGLEGVLRRKDVWRGHSQHFIDQAVIATGHDALDRALSHRGWLQGNLLELAYGTPRGRMKPSSWSAPHSQMDALCLAGIWMLCGKAITHSLSTRTECCVALLNPPSEPCAESAVNEGLALERVLIVDTQSKADFVACFVELARSPACAAIMAWQPIQGLSYPELRKCHLATLDQSVLAFMLRPNMSLKQNSPAALRMSVQCEARHLLLDIHKQKGSMAGRQLRLTLPDYWFKLASYRELLDKDLYEYDAPLNTRAAIRSIYSARHAKLKGGEHG